MDAIIVFFRDTLDGFPYYIIVVLNTIFIFAIIGYLGEKNNNKMLHMAMNVEFNPNIAPDQNAMSTPVQNSGGVLIPQVQATKVENPLASAESQPVSAVNQVIPVQPTAPVSTPTPSNVVVPTPVVNQVPVAPSTVIPTVPKQSDEVEKAPQVLVIDNGDIK